MRVGIRELLAALVLAVLALAPFHAAGQDKAGKTSDGAAAAQFRTAVALQKREQYDLAAEEWEAFLKDFSKDSRVGSAIYNLGLCRFNEKQYEKAVAQLGRLVKDFPQSDKLASGQYLLGVSHFYLAQAGDEKQFTPADDALQAFLDKHPTAAERPQALYFAGESKYLQGKKQDAAAMYARLIKDFPDDKLVVDATYNLGVAKQDLGEWDKAEIVFGAFVTKYPEHRLASEVKERHGETCFQQGKFADAQSLFAAAAKDEKYPRGDAAMLRQADCLLELKQYEQAAKVYAAMPGRFKKSAARLTALLAAGKCFFLAKQYAPAREALAQVLEIELTDASRDAIVEAAHWAAQSCLKENKPTEALKIADRLAGRAAPSRFAARLALDRADALFEIPERRAEAVEAYAAVVRDFAGDPAASQALYNAAFAALDAKEYAAALKFANEFQQKHPQDELAPACRYVAAEANLLSGQLPQAQEQYEALLAAQPKHADRELWQVRRGMSLYLQKQYAATIDALAPLADKIAAKDLAAEAHYLLGLSHGELKQHEPAATAFAASLAADANWRQADETRLALALAWRQLKQPQRAVEQLSQLAKREPASKVADQAHYWLAEIAYGDRDYSQAATLYEKVATQWPRGPLAAQALYGLGWSRFSLNEFEPAIVAFNSLIEKHGKSPLAARSRYARGLARRQLKDYSAAVDDLQAYLKTELKAEERSEARFAIALCQSGQNDHAGAEATLRGLLSDDPGFAKADEALYELAWALESQGKATDAAAAFARVAKDFAQSPLAAESQFRVGESHYKAEDYPAAVEAYRAAARGAKSAEIGEEAAHKLGWALFQLGKHEEARDAFSAQRKDFPQGARLDDAAFMIGETNYKLGKYKEALAAYALAKNPSDPRYAEYVLLHSGQASAFLEDWDESLEFLEAASKKFPESKLLPEILCEQGWALMHLERGDKAIPILESVTEKTDGEAAARARFLIGEIYFTKKNHAEAVRHFFKAAFGYGYPKWQAAAHFESGRCFEVLKKTKQAIESYQEIVDKFPESDKASAAKERLEALKKAS